MYIVAVDPGVHGAVTVLPLFSYLNVVSIPLVHNTLSDIILYLSEIRGGEPHRMIESLNALVPIEEECKNPNCPNLPLVNYVKESQSRCQHVPKSLRVVRGRSVPVNKVFDNSMEMWLEEPGQIVPYRKDKNTTGALLAGMTASRKLGRSVGQWEGIAAALNISVKLVSPKKWQNRLNCKTGGDKKVSKKYAETAFPLFTDGKGKSKITHDVADSMLIAMYAYIQYAEKLPQSFRKALQ